MESIKKYELFDFNSLNINIVKFLCKESMSFIPEVSISGMTYNEELNFWENFEKYKIDTSGFQLKVEVIEGIRKMLPSDEIEVERYLSLVNNYGISYDIDNIFINRKGHIFFKDLKSFSLKD